MGKEGFSLSGSGPVEKLADWRRAGGAMAPVSDAACERGGGAGRWGACCDVGDLVPSMRLRMALPSKGAPISSSDVLELRERDRGAGSERRSFWAVRRGCSWEGCCVEVGAINSFPCRTGDRFADVEDAVGDLARGRAGGSPQTGGAFGSGGTGHQYDHRCSQSWNGNGMKVVFW